MFVDAHWKSWPFHVIPSINATQNRSSNHLPKVGKYWESFGLNLAQHLQTLALSTTINNFPEAWAEQPRYLSLYTYIYMHLGNYI